MTADTAPGQAGATSGGPDGPGSARPSVSQRMQGMVRYGIWLAVVTRMLGERRFQASVITGAIRAYALASLIKNNQARPVRRAIHWYNMKGQIDGMKVLHRARRTLKQGKR